MKATSRAFAAVKRDGTVVSWGYEAFGGNSTPVQDKLTNVITLGSSAQAFACITYEETCISWGNELYVAEAENDC